MAKIKLLSFTFLSIAYLCNLQAQIGIGTTTPHSSSILDIESENKGFLPPRLSTQERDNINAPAIGLLIYNTDDECINFYNSTTWINPCNNGQSGGGGQGGNTNPYSGLVLQANSTVYISSVYDENYFPYTAPSTLANTGQSAPDGVLEPTIIDYQGVLTTSGITIRIPYLVFGASDVTLNTITQIKTIDPSHIEGGGSSIDIELQIPGGTFSPGSGFIDASLKALVTDLDVKRLDINEGMGTDLGVLISKFIIPVADNGETDTLQVKIIPSVPDLNFGNGTHDFVYLPVQAEDGNVWLTNNLGAEYADISSLGFSVGNKASSFNDEKSYGSKFQWGRKADGHELMTYTNSTSGSRVNSTVETTVSNTSTPVHSNFIRKNTIPYDWLSPQNNTLWDGKNAPNNPCPIGFRLPTQTEWINYKSASGVNTTSDAASSNLALSGNGSTSSLGTVDALGTSGFYWAGNATEIDDGSSIYTKAWSYFFMAGFSNASANNNVFGYGVRCIQNETNISSTSEGSAIIESVNDCNVASTGTLTVGQQAPAGVTQTINITVSKAGTYNIYAFNNGIQFFASGILNLGTQDVELTAVSNQFMTPSNSGVTTFSLNIPSGCTFDRIVN